MNKSFSSSSWYHRSSGEGWLPLLEGSLSGEAVCPKQRGARVPCTPGNTTMGDMARKPEPQQSKSGWRPLGPQRGRIPILGTLQNPRTLSHLAES